MQKHHILIIMFFGMVMQMCSVPKNNLPIDNPYPDDYRNMASLSHRNSWNGANVQDPSCIKVGDTYYLYSTDSYYIPPNINFRDDSLVNMGHVPIRSSKDLVHWNFEGWAFDQFPNQAFAHVKEANNGNASEGIWAPCINKSGSEYRLYYSLSYYGANGSFIGMATSKSPLGPWEDKGEVVKTVYDDIMNAIDPSVIKDFKTGKEWMMYGSFFGGLYCLELDPSTGLALQQGDKGKCVAQRGNGKINIIEAPEVMYNEEQDMYYLFMSYDPMFTYYNIRVGRSKQPNGPYLDFFGNDLKDSTNNYPVLTHSYKFNNHAGWSGNAHCSILKVDTKYFVLNQGRLAPDNLMTQLHTREIKWLKNGWPVFSPERYCVAENQNPIIESELTGEWEVIEFKELPNLVDLWQGQIPGGGWTYTSKAFNLSILVQFKSDAKVVSEGENMFISYVYNKESLSLNSSENQTVQCKLFRGWDWENKCSTILFSGIRPNGYGIWGKKVSAMISDSKNNP